MPQKGIKHTDEARNKIRLALLGRKRPELSGKNNPNWKDKIICHCHICKKLFAVYPSRINAKFCSRKCYAEDWKKRIPGHNFAGDNVGYSGAHKRVKAQRGNLNVCEICKTSDTKNVYEWANLTGKYADIGDYKRMCRFCHREYDAKREMKR